MCEYPSGFGGLGNGVDEDRSRLGIWDMVSPMALVLERGNAHS